MQLKPFISTPTGDIPIVSIPVKSGEKLRFLIIPSLDEKLPINAVRLEVYNPLEMRVVNSNLPAFDLSKIVYVDIIVPKNWISGIYVGVVLDSGNKIICSCYFSFSAPESAPLITKNLNPKWRINYGITVYNPSDKPVGNFLAYIALPISIHPQQIVKDLQMNPVTLKISTDVEGNHWTRMEKARIESKEKISMDYTVLIENRPLIISRNYSHIAATNPYEKNFLKKYLEAEPHIESDHPTIVKMASKITNINPIVKAKKFAKLVQQTLTYEIQPGEYGAAFAIENKKGDCTEYSALFVALCRAAGIPARTNAGFALTQNWERHAIAEFLTGGRWIPIDLTILRGGDIVLGAIPTFITITRGNWMGGTLTKEFSYKYQIINSSQKLDVQINWNITPENGNTIDSNKFKSKNIRIIEPTVIDTQKSLTQVIECSKIKILNIEEKTPSHKDIVLLKKKNISTEKKKEEKLFEISVDMPDAAKRDSLFQPIIKLTNNSGSVISGSFEIRETQNDILKLIAIYGKKISANSQVIIKPKIRLVLKGSNELEFVFLNRIGRNLAKTKSTISIY